MPWIERNESQAPGCYLICTKIGPPVLVQSDWEWPSLATSMGWDKMRVQYRNKNIVHLTRLMLIDRKSDSALYCKHRYTDGTVKCNECGIPAEYFIRYAGEFLDRIAK